MLITMAFTSVTKVFANGGNDNANTPLSVKSIASGKYVIEYSSDVKENVSLKIFDKDGKQLNKKMIKQGKAFTITYDLNNLPEGNYLVKLTSKNVNFSTNINHVKSKKPFFKAHIKSEEGNTKFNVRVIRQDMKPVVVTIQDNNNHVIFTESIDVDYNFEKNYNMKQFSSRAKYITVSSGINTVNYVVK